MVEQEAVNFEVAGSSPVPGATSKPFGLFCLKKQDSYLRLRLRCESSPGSQNLELEPPMRHFSCMKSGHREGSRMLFWTKTDYQRTLPSASAVAHFWSNRCITRTLRKRSYIFTHGISMYSSYSLIFLQESRTADYAGCYCDRERNGKVVFLRVADL